MKQYVVKRLLQLIPILLGITLLSFGTSYVSGKDVLGTFVSKLPATIIGD